MPLFLYQPVTKWVNVQVNLKSMENHLFMISFKTSHFTNEQRCMSSFLNVASSKLQCKLVSQLPLPNHCASAQFQSETATNYKDMIEK